MKGLLMKEFYLLADMKRLGSLAFVFVIFLFAFDSASFLSSYIPVMMLMITTSSFTYDEYYRWDSYALTLPLNRKTIVQSKYIFILIMMVVSILVSIGISFFLGSFKDLELIEILVSSFVSSLIFLIIYSVQIPIILKYGAEKGRYVMMGMFLILFLVGTAVLKLSWFDKIFQFIDGNIIVFGVGFVMISAVFFLASYCLSLKIYRKKEF